MKFYLIILLLFYNYCKSGQLLLNKNEERNYIVDLLESRTFVNKNDHLEGDIHTVRISRGINGFSGYLNFKMDVLEDFYYEFNLSYSVSGNSDSFITTPFRTPKTSVTKVLNVFYNEYVDPNDDCLNNAPVVNGTFKLPFPKRRIEFYKCTIKTKNFPSYMKPGYYNAFFMLKSEYFDLAQKIFAKIEPRN